MGVLTKRIVGFAINDYYFIASTGKTEVNPDGFTVRSSSHYSEKKKDTRMGVFFLFGGDEEDRTLDLTDANRTLSQLSYAPKRNSFQSPLSILPQETEFVKRFHPKNIIFL